MHKTDEKTVDPITVAEVKEIARKRLDPGVWDYYITGADEEYSIRRNENAYRE